MSSRTTPTAHRVSTLGCRRRAHDVGRKRVARLMRQAGLRGVSRRRGLTTTVRSESVVPANDLVKRDFEASGPDQLWVADITYVPTASSFLYLSVMVDAFSRAVVGWAMATHLRTELVLSAMEMALGQRRPEEVIHHSDRGSQYTSIAFGRRCERAGVRPSTGQSCYDNALFSGLLRHLRVRTHRARAVRLACSRRAWRSSPSSKASCNPQRRHSALDYHAPLTYEKLHRERLAAASC